MFYAILQQQDCLLQCLLTASRFQYNTDDFFDPINCSAHQSLLHQEVNATLHRILTESWEYRGYYKALKSSESPGLLTTPWAMKWGDQHRSCGVREQTADRHYSSSDWEAPRLAPLCSWVLPNVALIVHFAIIHVKMKNYKDIVSHSSLQSSLSGYAIASSLKSE